MPAELLTKNEHAESQAPSRPAVRAEDDELRVVTRRQLKRVRRLKLNVAAWVLGTILLTTLWVINEWQANGAFERFGHAGNPGDWNPTLWALAVGVWGLIVGIMALRVYFERPTMEADVDRAVGRLKPHIAAKDTPSAVKLRRFARQRIEGIRRLKFHVAAWVLGMIVLTPVWALIEWQDNGRFERFSNDSQPGEWEPWILYVAGVWALVVAILALHVYLDRPTTERDIDRGIKRLRLRG